jgi:hypothetical protein
MASILWMVQGFLLISPGMVWENTANALVFSRIQTIRSMINKESRTCEAKTA